MDMQMPVMDGFEASRMIRADPRLRDALLIAMSANAGAHEQANALAAGIDEFVTKPVSPNLLFEVIARWLRRRRAAAHAELQAPPAGMLDVEALAATFGGNPDKMRKYAFMFLDAAGDGLAELAEALARGDLGRAADLGQRMKASSRAVGAMDFSRLCHQLEQLRVGGALADARALLERLLLMRQQLAGQMAEELGQPAPI
jgi:HPt (histidine-containing phosphotransfer) domain-containing protein